MLLRQLEYFQAVVEQGNFYLAAERCHISQSAISQQIKKLEEEIGIKLLSRHNRTFTLTTAGEHFYRKSLVITGDIKQLIRETKRIGNQTDTTLHLGCYKGYSGKELIKAISEFSESYPTVTIQVTAGSHEELFEALENHTIDIALSDQRRVFSEAYNNIILAKSKTYIEISAKNPLSKLPEIEINELKNTPCILVANENTKEEEQQYCEKIIGLKSSSDILADSLQEARLKIATGQGFMLLDVIGEEPQRNTAIRRIPLTRQSEPITKTYCAFWKKNHEEDSIKAFANILKSQFQ